MFKAAFRCRSLAVLIAFIAVQSAFGQGTPADYDRSDHFNRLIQGKTFHMQVLPHWNADGKAFWYRNDGPDGTRDFVWVDAVAGTRRAAFDHDRLALALSAATGEKIEAARLPIDSIEAEYKPGLLVLHIGGKRWQVDLSSYSVTIAAGRARGAETLPVLREVHPSQNGEQTTITFTNHTDGPVELFWISTEGERVSYGTLAPGEKREQNTYAGHVWLIRNARGRTIAIFEAAEGGGDAIIEPRAGRNQPATQRGPEINDEDAIDDGSTGIPIAESPTGPRQPGESPDRKWIAFIRNYNVYIRDIGNVESSALTTDGKPSDSYGDDIIWSPDSKKLVALKTLDGDHRKVYLVQSSPPDQLQPKLESYDYLKPGDRIPLIKPHLFDVNSAKEIPVSDELFPNPWSLENVRWDADSKRFTFEYNQRGHQVFRVLAVDAETGKAAPIIDEQSKTFIDYSGKMFIHYLPETREIIWMSERDGWNHLYLYDSAASTVKNQITKGNWVVRKVDRVDAGKRQIYFEAGGIYPGQDPYYIHYCRINFDGSGLVMLTSGDGTHKITYSPDGRFFIDVYSRVDQPPITELHRSEDGKLLCELEKGDIHNLLKTGWKLPERFVANGRDGITDIYGVIYRPTTFDPKKKYPVIEDIYAGPQDSFVPKAFTRQTAGMQMAELGFIVVQIDGMGTSNRSKVFHDVCWHNLGDAGFPDRILWMKAAAAKYPFMDITRVGIYGTSAGGQDALRAVEAFGDFYKAAVADCGCHDNRMDKIWWNEQWMGWPIGPWYAEQSNVTNAKNLHGALLLIVGETDHNVDPASTMQVVNALIKADKDFDLLVIPNADHGQDGAYGNRRRKDFFVRHLLGVEPRGT
jgi:dipeptidyl aminopeptidase/acylaminoacyl peptidase